MLVGVNQNGLLAGLYLNRNDLILELAGLDCSGSLCLRSASQLVLHLTGDAVLLGNVLCGDAHVIVVEYIPNAVVYHHIGHDDVVHAGAPASLCHGVRCVGHGLNAAGQDALIVARTDDLRGQVQGTHGGCTDLVDGHCRGLERHTDAECNLTGNILAETSLKDAACDGLVDHGHVDAGLLDSSLCSYLAEFSGRNILESLAIGADRGSLCSTNVNVHKSMFSFLCGWVDGVPQEEGNAADLFISENLSRFCPLRSPESCGRSRRTRRSPCRSSDPAALHEPSS